MPPARALLLCARWRAFNALQTTIALEVVVAPPLHWTVRCAPDNPVNFSGADSRSWRVQSRSPLEHRTLSGVHRTCPVIYSEVPLKIPEGAKFGMKSPGAPDSPVRQTRAAFGCPLLFWLNPFLGLFIG